jgi:hypothetical protein
VLDVGVNRVLVRVELCCMTASENLRLRGPEADVRGDEEVIYL